MFNKKEISYSFEILMNIWMHINMYIYIYIQKYTCIHVYIEIDDLYIFIYMYNLFIQMYICKCRYIHLYTETHGFTFNAAKDCTAPNIGYTHIHKYV